jgi:hypothetical protein
MVVAADFETETDGEGTGAAEAVVAIETCLSGATSESAEGAAGFATGALAILAAAALSLTSEWSVHVTYPITWDSRFKVPASMVN